MKLDCTGWVHLGITIHSDGYRDPLPTTMYSRNRSAWSDFAVSTHSSLLPITAGKPETVDLEPCRTSLSHKILTNMLKKQSLTKALSQSTSVIPVARVTESRFDLADTSGSDVAAHALL